MGGKPRRKNAADSGGDSALLKAPREYGHGSGAGFSEAAEPVTDKLNGPATQDDTEEWFESRAKELKPGVRSGIEFLFDIAEARGFSDPMDLLEAYKGKTSESVPGFFEKLLPALEPPPCCKDATSELYQHAEASLGVMAMRRVAHDRTWPETFEELKDPKLDRVALFGFLERAVKTALGLPSLKERRDALQSVITSCEAARDRVLDAMVGRDATSGKPAVIGASELSGPNAVPQLQLAAAALASASASLGAELARVEGFTAMTPRKPSQGHPHKHSALVAAINEVLAFHGIDPDPSAKFIRDNLAEYWQYKDANVPNSDETLRLLAKSLSSLRGPKKTPRK